VPGSAGICRSCGLWNKRCSASGSARNNRADDYGTERRSRCIERALAMRIGARTIENGDREGGARRPKRKKILRAGKIFWKNVLH
jgi:hypothetical protein